jgi:hypothetical protein
VIFGFLAILNERFYSPDAKKDGERPSGRANELARQKRE